MRNDFPLGKLKQFWGGGVISFRLVNETRTIVLVQAGTQANQFARMIDRAGNVSVTEIRAGRSFFFPEDSKLTCR